MGSTCSSSETPIVEQVPDKDPVPDPPAEESAPAEPEAPAPKLTIMIMGARGLRNADWLPGMGTSDTFAKVKFAGKDDGSCLLQTKTIDDTLNPIWQEEASVFEFNGDEDLEFSVWDEDVGKKADSLGKVVMKNSNFATKGFNGEIQLEDAGKNTKAFLRVKVRVGTEDYPAGPAAEYTIKLDKDPKTKALGLDVDETDGQYIYVINVRAGPFKTYNETADVDKQLRNGDFIVRVNDKEGSAQDMLEELKSKRSFEIVARHPEEFTVAIKRAEAKSPLGLEFQKKLTGNALLILAVKAGPFQEWNDANEAYKVEPNDRVVSVAGIQGKAVELQKKMLSVTSYQAIIARPAKKDSSSS